MRGLAPRTPIIVGIGFHQERMEDPTRCAEPYQLMVRAVRSAAEHAGFVALLKEIDSISVPQGMWQYRNPGKLIADALGCPAARSVVSDLGVLQLTLLSDLCAARDVPVPLTADYAGPATIVGYTVMFNRDEPSHAVAICDTPSGERTVVRTENTTLLKSMTREEFCGRVIAVFRGGRFDIRE